MNLRGRHRHRGLHGHEKINRKRRTAIIMVATGTIRTLGWLALTVAYLTHLSIAVKLFASVSFVAVLSSLALAETAWSQVAGSLAQLSADDAHQVAEETHRNVNIDMTDIDRDLKALASMRPSKGADLLAENISKRLGAG